jgi:hypothetical protein
MSIFTLSKSTRKDKKFMVVQKTPESGQKKRIHFGALGYDDFTTHKDEARKQRYISRHKKREDWSGSKKSLASAGFWSKWILWNKSTISESIKDTENRFGISISIKY